RLHWIAGFVDDFGEHTGQRLRARAWLGRRHAGYGRHHDGAGLGLPPRVDDRELFLADDAVIPDPRLRIDRLADAAEQAQLREIVLVREFLAGFHQRADRGRRGVEDRDLVVLADPPEAPGVGNHRAAFVHDDRRAARERAVADVAVTGDPADVRRAPEHVVVAQIEDPLSRHVHAEQIPGRRMLDAFGLAGRARRVEQIQRMLGVDPFRLARRALLPRDVVPPAVAPGFHRHVVAGALVDEHVLDRRAAGRERFVDRFLELDDVAAARAAIRGDDRNRARVL